MAFEKNIVLSILIDRQQFSQLSLVSLQKIKCDKVLKKSMNLSDSHEAGQENQCVGCSPTE